MSNWTRTFGLIALVTAMASPAAADAELSLRERVAALERQNGALAEHIADLEAALAEMRGVLRFVRVEEGELEGLTGPHWIVEGANVHVRSGRGSTDDHCVPGPCPLVLRPPLGNLIVGYNERPSRAASTLRAGNHNLVVGRHHSFASWGGFVAGESNAIRGPFATVTGGVGNEATGFLATVSGGRSNLASGPFASVSGGGNGEARGVVSSVSGGFGNLASGSGSSVSGGEERTAAEINSWAAGSLFEPN